MGLLCGLVAVGFFVVVYVRFSRMIDARLNGRVFTRPALLCAAPTEVFAGQPATLPDFINRLQKAGYTVPQGGSKTGTYEVSGNRLTVRPGDESFFRGDIVREGAAVLRFQGSRLSSITALRHNTELENYWLEPQVITPLFGSRRAKQQVVRYDDLPDNLVHAVLAAEDSQFFTEYGVSFYRIIGAAIADIRAGAKVQGASTITMQLARNFFLTPRRTYKRKIEEIMIAFMLEHKLGKKRIFELYANEVYLGQRDSFSIYGFGAAASAYFNKDVASLTLPEEALLAGIIRGPSLYSPSEHPTRAIERRNYVIGRMLKLGYITAQQATDAEAAPLGVVKQSIQGNEAPYFVDMVRDRLLSRFTERDLLTKNYRVYTTLNLDLQHAADEAMQQGMKEVTARLKHTKRAPGPPPGPDQPQAALMAIDPHTGDVLALDGGRNYAESQLNHILARRQPGSTFKPFAYAAALDSGIDGSQPLITSVTTLLDEPTVFHFGDQDYEPEDYEQDYHGVVTVRQALEHSLNVASVRLATMVGFEKIRQIALAAGINHQIQATPAIALGAYVVTPLEMTGGYTIFANGGQYIKPRFILEVKDPAGRVLWHPALVTRTVLDPRISFLVTNLMESVIDHGTGVGVRLRGFNLPCAGKTGTANDGWFIGFTSNLLATAWVGYDDDRDLNLAGADSALPIWTDFMKMATLVPPYQNAQPFVQPPGIVTETVNDQGKPVSGSADDPGDHLEYFISGTQPQSGGAVGGLLGRMFRALSGSSNSAPAQATAATSGNTPADAANGPAQSKNKGLLNKFLSIFKSRSSKPKNPKPPQL